MLKSARANPLALFPDVCIEPPIPNRDRSGFPRVSLLHRGREATFSVHRLIYSFFIAPIPPGVPVRHTCNNPACVNPRHLISGATEQPSCSEARHG